MPEKNNTAPSTEPQRVVILGVNERIYKLIELLHEQQKHITVVALDFSHYGSVAGDPDVHIIEGDFLDPKLLTRAKVEQAAAVIILTDTQQHSPQDADARSVVATLSVERINSDVKTVVEVHSDETAFHLENANVDEIIQSGDLTADILAFSTNHPNYSNHLETLLRFTYKNHIVTAPVRERLLAKTISEVTSILARERKILLGVRVKGDRKRETLDPSYALESEDEMVYVDIL